MLQMSREIYEALVAHCLVSLPDEGCGLLAGVEGADVAERCYTTTNAANSARLYEVDPTEMLAADRDAEAKGWVLIGVFHSHTHSDPYPSATDVAQAPDPAWHYVLVGLAERAPVVRSYRIVEGGISEEELLVV